jgi:large subunit ribosomal protein L21
MYAIIRSGGKQFVAREGAVLLVPSIKKNAGDTLDMDVLATAGPNGTKFGSASVSGVRVAATVLGHEKGDKIIVFKMKRRKQYKRKQGHRQEFTRIRIDSIQ